MNEFTLPVWVVAAAKSATNLLVGNKFQDTEQIELPNKEDVLLDYPKVFECIKNNCNESADEIKDALVRMSDSWADGLMNPDDITIVVIKKAS